MEEFNLGHQPTANRNLIAHLGAGLFISEAKNVVLADTAGTGKTRVEANTGIKAAETGQRVPFHSATR
nr:ATP-binding protein [Arthrobacter sp. TB 23]